MSIDPPVYGCTGCASTIGRAGCPTHRDSNAITDEAGKYHFTGSQLVLTHCIHGLDLRLHPRCYLCAPVGVRESWQRLGLPVEPGALPSEVVHPAPFTEEWDDPAMDVYDEVPIRTVTTPDGQVYRPAEAAMYEIDRLLVIRRWVYAIGSIDRGTGRRIRKIDVLDVIDAAIRKEPIAWMGAPMSPGLAAILTPTGTGPRPTASSPQASASDCGERMVGDCLAPADTGLREPADMIKLPRWETIADILHEMASIDGCEPGCEAWHEDEAKVMLNIIRDALRKEEDR